MTLPTAVTLAGLFSAVLAAGDGPVAYTINSTRCSTVPRVRMPKEPITMRSSLRSSALAGAMVPRRVTMSTCPLTAPILLGMR